MRGWLRAQSRRLLVWALLVPAALLACARSGPAPRSAERPAPPSAVAEGRPADAAQASVSPGEETAEVASEAEQTPEEATVEPAPREAPRLAAPNRLRVGLATDLTRVVLPCCEDRVVGEAGGRVVAATSPLRIEPDARVLAPGFFRLQAAALKDEGQARRLAETLGSELEAPADVVFDAATDLYRVRVGRFATREAADAADGRLARMGVAQAWVVGEKAKLAEPALRITQAGRSQRVAGRWLTVRSQAGEGLRYGDTRYRGRLLIYLNDRGSLNVINDLKLDDYLRGVVPREMGPELYDSLEALKAQTVAARTYTLNNLGEFRAEGYDICATPRCQVYGGIGSEHPLADRAVRETAGEVLTYEGGLIDAMYSSTCGGHTEDVNVVFPLKNEPYLRGVGCLEAGVDRLSGKLPAAATFPAGLLLELLPPGGPLDDPRVVGARLEHLALLAGLPIPEDRLASLERREVQRFIASIFDLALEARLFLGSEELAHLLAVQASGWSERDRRLAGYLTQSGLLAGELTETLSREQLDDSLFRLALHLRVLERVEGRYLGLAGDALRLRIAGGEIRPLGLTDRLTTFRRRGQRLAAAPLGLAAGDRVTAYLSDGALLAVTHEAESDATAFDTPSRRGSWSRFHSNRKLAAQVNARFPGVGFAGFEVLSRGVSGRVGRIRIDGDEGKSVTVDGLAIRWTLDLPDTLFTARRATPPGKGPGWLFTGRGWGHGVGLCQVGAYGMGVRGYGYQEILLHYYTGVDLTRLAPRRAAAVAFEESWQKRAGQASR